MANFVITGKAEQTDESSYIVQSTGEVITKIQLTLNVPGMTDRVLCEMPLDVLAQARDSGAVGDGGELAGRLGHHHARAGFHQKQRPTRGESRRSVGHLPGDGRT